jgi:FkbM family methyltransferase
VAKLDLRDVAPFALMNISLGDLGAEAPVLQWLGKMLRPGDVFWDVGASVGAVSAYFAHPKHKLARIDAFEPNPSPYQTLRSLFSNNPLVKTHPFGMGDTDGSPTMSLSEGCSNLSSLATDFQQGLGVQVQIRRGDTLRRELALPPPNVLKIDVEGFEPQVFAGLSETIAESRPFMIFEHSHLSDEQVSKLTLPNYHLYFILPQGGLTMDPLKRTESVDAIFFPAEKPRALLGQS